MGDGVYQAALELPDNGSSSMPINPDLLFANQLALEHTAKPKLLFDAERGIVHYTLYFDATLSCVFAFGFAEVFASPAPGPEGSRIGSGSVCAVPVGPPSRAFFAELLANPSSMATAHRRPPTRIVFLRYSTMTFRLDMYALMLVGCGSLLHDAAERPSAVSSCSRIVTAPTTRFLSPKRPGSVTSAQMYAFLG